MANKEDVKTSTASKRMSLGIISRESEMVKNAVLSTYGQDMGVVDVKVDYVGDTGYGKNCYKVSLDLGKGMNHVMVMEVGTGGRDEGRQSVKIHDGENVIKVIEILTQSNIFTSNLGLAEGGSLTAEYGESNRVDISLLKYKGDINNLFETVCDKIRFDIGWNEESRRSNLENLGVIRRACKFNAPLKPLIDHSINLKLEAIYIENGLYNVHVELVIA